MIAPGLAAIFNVRFAPDSLASYEDEILVECSNGSKLVVPLVGKRESPNLTSSARCISAAACCCCLSPNDVNVCVCVFP